MNIMRKNPNLRNRYNKEDYLEKTVEQMHRLIQSLEDNYGDVDQAWITSLDLIAMNYDLLYQAYDDIKETGNTATASKGRLSKNPSISIFMNAQNNIQNILSKNGLTLMSKVRAKKFIDDGISDDDEFEQTFLKD